MILKLTVVFGRNFFLHYVIVSAMLSNRLKEDLVLFFCPKRLFAPLCLIISHQYWNDFLVQFFTTIFPSIVDVPSTHFYLRQVFQWSNSALKLRPVDAVAFYRAYEVFKLLFRPISLQFIFICCSYSLRKLPCECHFMILTSCLLGGFANYFTNPFPIQTIFIYSIK